VTLDPLGANIAFTAGFLVLGGQLGLNASSATLYPTFMRSTGAGWSLGIGRVGSIAGPIVGGILISTGISRLSGGDPDEGVFPYPRRLGMWPAAVGLFAFVWMELVYPHNVDLSPVRLWCGVYLGVMIIGGALYGNSFYGRADPFEVYSSLVARVSVWGRRDGRLV